MSVTSDLKQDLGVLNDDDWFRKISSTLRDRILREGMIRKYAGGSLVYSAGDPPSGMFCVISGEVRLVNYSSQGKFVFYTTITPGHWFGILSDLDGVPRFSDAMVGPDSVIFSVSPSTIKRLLKEEPDAPSAFLLLVCYALRLSLQEAVDKRAASPRSRIIQKLWYLHTQNDGAHSAPCSTYITQEALAAMVDLSRQTVGKVLRGLQAEGLVDLRYGQVRPINGSDFLLAMRAATSESLHLRV